MNRFFNIIFLIFWGMTAFVVSLGMVEMNRQRANRTPREILVDKCTVECKDFFGGKDYPYIKQCIEMNGEI